MAESSVAGAEEKRCQCVVRGAASASECGGSECSGPHLLGHVLTEYGALQRCLFSRRLRVPPPASGNPPPRPPNAPQGMKNHTNIEYTQTRSLETGTERTERVFRRIRVEKKIFFGDRFAPWEKFEDLKIATGRVLIEFKLAGL